MELRIFEREGQLADPSRRHCDPGLKSNEDARMFIHDLASPSMLLRRLWMEPGWSNAKYITALTVHPCHIHVLVDGALVERADRSRRSDRDAPNERSVAQMGAELWLET